MTTQTMLALLVAKLVEIRVFVRGAKDVNKHPVPVYRAQLEGFLRMTQTELFEGFGVKSPNKLTLTVRKAIAVMARIHKGADSYRTIGEKAEVLIKRLHPIYVAQLERLTLESSRKAAREALEKRFATLSGGKALPDGTESPLLSSMVTELRDDLVAKTQRLMNEVSEPALRHPDVSRLADQNLVAIKKLLDARFKELHAVRPRTFAEQFAQRNAVQ